MRGKNSVYSILMIFVLLSFLPELCISFENSDDFNRKIVYEKIFSKRNFNTIQNIHNDIKSQDVIITLMSFSSNLYINDTQIIDFWSQNISSQSRILYHKLSGTFPDGSPFYQESTHVLIQPGKSLNTIFTIQGWGEGIGIFNFSCEVWEEIDLSLDIQHSWKSNSYFVTFHRPTGVSENYYCDDEWHHPSDIRIYERALLIAGGSTTEREAAQKLMNYVNTYITYDENYGKRTEDIYILAERRGDCNDFADLYIGFARSINIPSRIILGTFYHQTGGIFNDDVCGTYCTNITYDVHAWAESYYNGRFQHVDPTCNTMEYPFFYINSSPDIHSVHASAYTACSDFYLDNCFWIYDAECCLNGFSNVTLTGYDTEYFCPSNIDGDVYCDSLDADRDGDGIPNLSDSDPCTGADITFSAIPHLFSSNNFHVVGNSAYCTDVLGTANLSWVYGLKSIERPEGRTHTILPFSEHETGNLLITGGPAINPVADEFNRYFGIEYTLTSSSFSISCENHTISIPLQDYPQKDIAIVYLGNHMGRNALVIWGYGWQGTYAATVLVSHPDIWSLYGNEHLLMVQWTDSFPDGLVSWDKITITYPYHITVPAPSPGSWYLVSPVFKNMKELFGGDSFHVVGNSAYCTDVLGTANLSWVYGLHFMQRPEGRTDTILGYIDHETGNLVITGGPAINPLASEFDTRFGISYTYTSTYFSISSDGYSLGLNLNDYPHKDIAIIHLGRENSRNILLVWGYGWQGTYAGTVILSDPSFWTVYADYHMVLLEWVDSNGDGLVQRSEITIRYAGYGPHIA